MCPFWKGVTLRMPLTLSTSAMLSEGWPWPSPNSSDLASRSFSVKINLESTYCVLHILARAFLADFIYVRGQLNMLKKTHWSLFIHSCSVIALTKRVFISITFLKSKKVFFFFYYFHPQYRIHLERLQKVSLIWTVWAVASFGLKRPTDLEWTLSFWFPQHHHFSLVDYLKISHLNF